VPRGQRIVRWPPPAWQCVNAASFKQRLSQATVLCPSSQPERTAVAEQLEGWPRQQRPDDRWQVHYIHFSCCGLSLRPHQATCPLSLMGPSQVSRFGGTTPSVQVHSATTCNFGKALRISSKWWEYPLRHANNRHLLFSLTPRRVGATNQSQAPDTSTWSLPCACLRFGGCLRGKLSHM
jgi:hypothetical protein